MRINLRSRLFLSQAVIMAVIMLILSLLMGYFLNRSLIANLDKFLHQQADNFKATINIKDGVVTFHDLNPGFKHIRPIEEEIPFHIQMLDLQYQTVMLSGNLKGRTLYIGDDLPMKEFHRTIRQNGDILRQLITPLIYDDQHIGWIIVSVSYQYLDSFRNQLQRILTLATLVAIILLTITSFFFVRWSLRPVVRLAERVNQRTQDDIFNPLPPLEGDDEFAYLTQTFNGLLSKAKTAMDVLERFSADASHELKTPLAVMRTELIAIDEKLKQGESVSLVSLNQEISRMQQLIENLLVLSYTSLPYTLKKQEIWLNDFLADETSRIEQLYGSRKISFNLDAVDSVKIMTDVYLLYIVYVNLLRNAVHHTPPSGTIWITGF